MIYNPYQVLEQIFFGVELDSVSLYKYDFKLINLLANKITTKHIDIIVNEDLDYESFIMMDDEDINFLNLPIGPKIAIRNIIKKENLKLKIQKEINEEINDINKYLILFNNYQQLDIYKSIFLENNITYNTFILLTKKHLANLGIPKGPAMIIYKIIEDIRFNTLF